jgi:hypothetical protein
MKAKEYLLIAILSMCHSAALAAKPIENLIDIPVPSNIDGSMPSLEEIKSASIRGCKDKRWTPVVDEGGDIACSILVRSRHFAEVEITYTETSYSIIYKDSRELDYNEEKQRIHRNYNKWVILLSDATQQVFATT